MHTRKARLLGQNRKISILAVFLVFFVASANLSAQIKQVSSFLQLEEELADSSSKALVLVDLDGCLFQSATFYGSASWLFQEINDRISQGKTREEAIQDFYPQWIKAQSCVPIELVDPNAPQVVCRIQEKKIPIVGFTHRQPIIAPQTLNQLDRLGIDFTQTDLFTKDVNINYKNSPLFASGVVFIHEFNSKGSVLAPFLQEVQYFPDKILFIDDRKEHLLSVEQASQELGIAFVGLHFFL